MLDGWRVGRGEKERATVEETFKNLVRLAGALDEEEQRAVQEGLSEDELAVFDLLLKQDLSKSERERIKQVSQMLLTAIIGILPTMTDWTKTEATQAAVRVLILDTLWQTVPQRPTRRTNLSR